MKVGAYFRNGIGNFLMLTPALLALKEMGHIVDLFMCRNPDKPGRSKWLLDFAKEYEGSLVRSVFNADPEQREAPKGYDRLIAYRHGERCALRNAFNQAGALGDYNAIEGWHQHEVSYYLRAVRQLGWRKTDPGMVLPPPVTNGKGSKHPGCVVLCNGSNSAPEWKRKRWPAEYWPELVWAIRRYTEREVVFVGSATEAEDHAIACKDGLDGVHDLTGRTTLMETATILRSASLAVTTDTGTMHIAAAAGTPTVALFGPTRQSKNRPWFDPRRWSDGTEPCVIVDRDIPCRPCQYNRKWHSCQEPVCMSEIAVGDIMNAVRQLWRREERRAA